MKIPVYEAPDRAVRTEREGYAANETAGRRIGPAFDRAASDVRDIGNVSASIYKQRLWPWDILELEQGQTTGSGRGRGGSGGGGGGGGVHLEGGHSSGFDLGGAGATGRLGNVAATMAQAFTGTPTNRGTGQGGGRGFYDVEKMFAGGKSAIINDPRALQPGKFPEKIGEQSPPWQGRFQQPANPDFLRRDAEQMVWRDPFELPAPSGYTDTGGNYGGGYSPAPIGGGQQMEAPGLPSLGAEPETWGGMASRYGSGIWSGISDAMSYLGSGFTPSTEGREDFE